MTHSQPSPLAGLSGIDTETVGSRILARKAVGSTNDLASGLARSGDFVEGQVIFAEAQSAGRGRMGRDWTCPDGKGILMSAILTPSLATHHLPAATAIGALAALDAIDSVVPGRAQIRWPNDVVVEDKKIAGVLAKIERVKRSGHCFIIGIGLNVNVAEAEIPKGIQPATSLLICRGKPVDRLGVAESLLRALDRWYATLKSGDFAAIEERLREHSSLIGRRITVKSGGEILTGEAVGISLVDGITIRLHDGASRTCHESTTTLSF